MCEKCLISSEYDSIVQILWIFTFCATYFQIYSEATVVSLLSIRCHSFIPITSHISTLETPWNLLIVISGHIPSCNQLFQSLPAKFCSHIHLIDLDANTLLFLHVQISLWRSTLNDEHDCGKMSRLQKKVVFHPFCVFVIVHLWFDFLHRVLP